MKKLFAIPIQNGQLTQHFGHCEKFAIITTDDNNITKEELITPPVHQPGVYPKFLAGQGVHVIIAGGMGQKAQDLFAQHGIQVCVGVQSDSPLKLVEKYLNKELATGGNQCTH